MEEFRSVVDGVVLWCRRDGQITPEDFVPGPPERPVILNEAGQRRFLQTQEHAWKPGIPIPNAISACPSARA